MQLSEIVEQLETAARELSRRFLYIGRIVYTARKEIADLRLKDIVDGLRQRGIELSEGTLSRMATIWGIWVVQNKIPPSDLEGCDWEKLYEVAAFLARRPTQDASEWLEKVKTLDRESLRQLIYEQPLGDPKVYVSLPMSVKQRAVGLTERIGKLIGVAEPIPVARVIELALVTVEEKDDVDLVLWYEGLA